MKFRGKKNEIQKHKENIERLQQDLQKIKKAEKRVSDELEELEEEEELLLEVQDQWENFEKEFSKIGKKEAEGYHGKGFG
ncbi:hypothetical protein OCU04_010250 [Sclerotinia nivalis]|uniref:Uncharacterized protein n=1 Tax=Sclerotinia nivalis TaxID=352851 RepID=A0A9X0AEB9_9HELO|nr:hypothetical protein OCU04_010250 [Sclerotinia nivalis]